MSLFKKVFTAAITITMAMITVLALIRISADQKPSVISNDYGQENRQISTFAGGCFWCVEAAFQETPGVIKAVSGFMGGAEANPTYKQVAAGHTGHREVVQVTYDAQVISYQQLLTIFFQNINPTDDGGQFGDRGFQYTTSIYTHDQEQLDQATDAIRQLREQNIYIEPIATQVVTASTFYTAPDYHQDYYQKNPLRYQLYYMASGRKDFVENNKPKIPQFDTTLSRYKRPNQDQIRAMLTDFEYQVTQEEATEPAFDNAYWDNTDEGIYVDIVTGEPLFSSKHKYKSGTGWPSFYQPLAAEHIVLKKDYKLIIPRTEVRSKYGDSHLGHVFNDGPNPTGLRYCINSASLRFIPKDQLEAEGYQEYASHFDQSN